jgi:hypothetical protein
MMHGMQRYLSDILGHSWARSIAKAAQRLVTHFEVSNGAKQLLLEMRLDLGIVGPSLQTSNKTRFTSVCSMLESIDRNAPALQMLGSHPHFAPCQAVARSKGPAADVADILSCATSARNLTQGQRRWMFRCAAWRCGWTRYRAAVPRNGVQFKELGREVRACIFFALALSHCKHAYNTVTHVLKN